MYRVYISPSKQETNKGVGNYGTEEKRMNEIADVVCKCLTASGITWARNNTNWDSSQIVRDSNNMDVDLHVALHSNAGGGEGTEVLIYKRGGNAEKFAKILYDMVAPMTPAKDRGIKTVGNVAELSKTTAPAALIEYAFHDDKEDSEYITQHIQELGMATAAAICTYFGVSFINPYHKERSTYSIIVSGFNSKTDAEEWAEYFNKSNLKATVK